jgi:hypothetical protein
VISPRIKQALAHLNRTLLVIWFSFLTASLLYVMVAYLITTREPLTRVEEGPNPILLVLATAAAATIAAGWLLLRRRVQTAGAAADRALASGKVSLAGNPARSLADIGPAEAKVLALAGHYQTSLIIGWACYEATAVYGLVATVLTQDLRYVAAGTIIAATLLALHRPQLEDFLQYCRERGWIQT